MLSAHLGKINRLFTFIYIVPFIFDKKKTFSKELKKNYWGKNFPYFVFKSKLDYVLF